MVVNITAVLENLMATKGPFFYLADVHWNCRLGLECKVHGVSSHWAYINKRDKTIKNRYVTSQLMVKSYKGKKK